MARPEGQAVADLAGAGGDAGGVSAPGVARRVASAWMRQALGGRIVPIELDPRALTVHGDQLVLTDAAFALHSGADRTAFAAYARAVAEDDPDAAAEWLLGGAPSAAVEQHEEELRRRLRQAVPFRDGEWSGDDRFAESALVHWRMARQAGWQEP